MREGIEELLNARLLVNSCAGVSTTTPSPPKCKLAGGRMPASEVNGTVLFTSIPSPSLDTPQQGQDITASVPTVSSPSVTTPATTAPQDLLPRHKSQANVTSNQAPSTASSTAAPPPTRPRSWRWAERSRRAAHTRTPEVSRSSRCAGCASS